MPSTGLFDNCIDIGQRRAIAKFWKATVEDLVELRLGLLLDFWVQAYRQDERKNSRHSLGHAVLV
jgi:hypothetical protein